MILISCLTHLGFLIGLPRCGTEGGKGWVRLKNCHQSNVQKWGQIPDDNYGSFYKALSKDLFSDL